MESRPFFLYPVTLSKRHTRRGQGSRPELSICDLRGQVTDVQRAWSTLRPFNFAFSLEHVAPHTPEGNFHLSRYILRAVRRARMNQPLSFYVEKPCSFIFEIPALFL
jgi:hypothetical protein